MLRDNPMVKKLMATGEEQMGRLAQQLMANEKFVAVVQTVVTRSLAAKGTMDGALRTALSAMNLPTTTDVEQLRAKVEDLERLVTSVEARVQALSSVARQ